MLVTSRGNRQSLIGHECKIWKNTTNLPTNRHRRLYSTTAEHTLNTYPNRQYAGA